MDSKLKRFVYVLTIVSLIGELIIELGLVAAEPKVPCLFFFGDSLFDNGNNNFLNTNAKVNYKPYGVDFPDGPTGRFSNGRNIADYVANHLGFPSSPPPFTAANNQDLLRGVNYASGGSGILAESGSRQGDTISLNQQISNHQASISRIESLLASKQAASDHLHKCIYAVNMGSNDYINNYLLPKFYNSSQLYKPHEYADMLIKQYNRDIMNLYNSGARKVALFGLGQIGCTPTQRALAGKKGCVKSVNVNVQLFNERLKSLVVGLNNVFRDAKFIFIDVMEITTVDLVFIIINYKPYGVDFPDGPTGRFSNGRNIADYVANHLGFPSSPPPFTAANNQDLLRGVNYASGGSGILAESGSRQGDTISLNQQISNHQASISRIESLLASKQAASDRLHKCIYAVNMGSNDYINNYLLPKFYNSSQLYKPHEYADMLIKQYNRDIMNLYNSGARKVALFGLGQIGCTPTQRALAGKKGCVKSVNVNVQLFNERLKSLVVGLNNVFRDAKFIFIDVMEITTVDLVFIRLSSTGKSCCKVSTTEAGQGQCLRNEAPCFLRETFSYYDGFHPTQIACNIIATGSYYALLPSYAYPYGIRQLAKL